MGILGKYYLCSKCDALIQEHMLKHDEDWGVDDDNNPEHLCGAGHSEAELVTVGVISSDEDEDE